MLANEPQLVTAGETASKQSTKMKYQVEVQKTRSERRRVEATTLEDALKMAQAGEGESMNEGQVSVTAYGREYIEPCRGLSSEMLATGIRSASEVLSDAQSTNAG